MDNTQHNQIDTQMILAHLEAVIASRRNEDSAQSYVAKLLASPIDKVLKKIGEEATEVVIAGKDGARDAIIYESADLIFHLLVLLAHTNVSFEEILLELRRRLGVSGIAEKASRKA